MSPTTPPSFNNWLNLALLLSKRVWEDACWYGWKNG